MEPAQPIREIEFHAQMKRQREEQQELVFNKVRPIGVVKPMQVDRETPPPIPSQGFPPNQEYAMQLGIF